MLYRRSGREATCEDENETLDTLHSLTSLSLAVACCY